MILRGLGAILLILGRHVRSDGGVWKGENRERLPLYTNDKDELSLARNVEVALLLR